jgi:hypothetical protein
MFGKHFLVVPLLVLAMIMPSLGTGAPPAPPKPPAPPPAPKAPPPPPPNQQQQQMQQMMQNMMMMMMMGGMGGFGMPYNRPPPVQAAPAAAPAETVADYKEMTISLAKSVSISARQAQGGYRPADLKAVAADASITVFVKAGPNNPSVGQSWRLTGKCISVDDSGDPKTVTLDVKMDATTSKLDPAKLLGTSITVTSLPDK